MGLTRTARSLEINMDCLEGNEAVRVARRMFKMCGIKGTPEERKRRSEISADTTKIYPPHLHNGLEAPGRLLEGRGTRDLGDVHHDEWRDKEAAARRRA